MITGRNRFNIYLLLGILAWVCGCHTTSKEKDEKDKKDELAATLEVHLEALSDTMDFSESVPIFRAHPVMVIVDKNAFVTEANISEAKVIEVQDGFMMQIQFDRRGTWLLEEYTTTNPGKHYAIYCTYGKKLEQSRWLSAPIIQKRISNGTLAFTPDATREETDLIVAGLNAVAKKVEEKSKW